MAENILINGTTYPGVASVELNTTDGKKVLYFQGQPVEVVQETGTDTAAVMSQAAVTNALNTLSNEKVDVNAVQNLTEEQKAQARANIGAVTVQDVLAALPESDGKLEPAENDIPKFFFGAALPQTKTDTVMPFRYISKTADISGYCKTKAQGNSSMSYPKKNQTVKLYVDAECTETLKVNFNGWGKQNKFCFKANWIDLTHARNVVSARLWGGVVESRSDYERLPEELRTSPNQGAVDGFPVKVYAAGVYQGRYTINIPKDPWMANMNDELDNHCILCGENYVSGCFRASANINGADWTDEVHDTVPETIKTRWNEVISFVMNSNDEDFKANLSNYFFVDSLIDYYLFGLVSCGLDAFGKNQLYMTYDGQRWVATMYDMDSTWGLWWTGESFVSADYARNDFQDFKDGEGNLLYIRLANLFKDEIKARWVELKAGVLSASGIINRFERFTDICPPWLVEEDYAETTVDGAFTAIPSKHTNNIQQIRSNIVERRAYVESLFADYTEVEYLESSGTQWIDTGISGGANAEYEIRFSSIATSEALAKGGWYFGGDGDAPIPGIAILGNTYLMCTSAAGYKTIWAIRDENASVIRFIDRELFINADGPYVPQNNSGGTFVTGDASWGARPWFVFSVNQWREPSYMRLYYLKMWTNGDLVRDFIPVVRNTDGVACLYDKVTEQYFENAGTGTFIVPVEVTT